MSVNFNASNVGMDNRGTNLFQQAVERARDGNLDAADLQALGQTAMSDDVTSTSERNFLASLRSNGAEFVAQVQSATAAADFDPQNFSWGVSDRTVVQTASGKDVTLVFSDHPEPHKQVSGDIDEARRTLDSLSGNRWSSVSNPHDINAVRDFISSVQPPMSTADKMQFAQAYLTAYYNHPGVDIAWNGASLQEGIDAVPTDANGRKYLDCEAYLETARQITGLNIEPYVLDADMSGTRNHQVGVLRDGDRAYVLSNNEVQSLEVNGRSDADLIQAAHPDFDDIAADRSGAMKVGTECLSVGDFLPNNEDITVTQIIDGSTATGRRALNDGTSVNVQITFNVDTGEFRSRINPQAGDVLVDGSGNQISMTSGSNGTITLPNGTTAPVVVSVAADGSWSWRG